MNYNDAINFKSNHRNKEPATYNIRRLSEHPIPNLNAENTIEEDLEPHESSSESDEFGNNGKLKHT